MKIKIYALLLSLLLLLSPVVGRALPLDTYAGQSRLAAGRWVKVSVSESGIYAITNAQLQKWGFGDAAKVRVYGYGARRISDALTASNYIDDLPLVQSLSTSQGLIFYAVGPEQWTASSAGAYVNTSNIYTSQAYYFLSDATFDDDAPTVETVEASLQGEIVEQYVDRLHYELDRVSLGESGWLLLGENLKSGAAKVIFDTPDAKSAVIECAIVSDNTNSGTIQISVNGQTLTANADDKVNASGSNNYVHGAITVTNHDVESLSDKTTINVSVQSAAAMNECRLDYVSLSVLRALKMKEVNTLNFWLDSPSAALQTNGKSDIAVWDVTDPLNIAAMQLRTRDDGAVAWSNPKAGSRSYAAFSASASLPAPTYVGTVANQNLHGMEADVDMVVLSAPDFMAQGQRIAQLHANASVPLKVAVVNVEHVYNEFGSGAPDISALRKFLKMLYDRGNASDSTVKLKYALLLGRPTYDHRQLTAQFDGVKTQFVVPCWMGDDRRSQLSDNTGYGTDDFIAMLEDYSGTNLGLDDLSIAVGRIPARNVDEIKSSVDKLQQYMQKNKHGAWKNSFVFLADDGDNGVHARQTENMIAEILNTPDAHNFISKVYVDAYDIIGGSCEGGRQDMYRMLDEGVVWWNFAGHANNHSWTAENMLNYNDINNLFLSRLPVLMAATCDFLRWDSSTESGGEILFNHRYGGNIATISATRPVYITDNGYFTRAVGRAINTRDENGQRVRLGDIYRIAKNNILTDAGDRRANKNRLRFVLMGDPALCLAIPSNIVTLDQIEGVPVDTEAQITIKALQRLTMSGSVRTPQGEIIDDFQGVVQLHIYDAERSITTQGKRDDNVPITFEQHGNLLFSGSATVSNGQFTINVAMPGEVADNFRPATANMYAYSSNGTEASGLNSDFYVYGLDESAPIDEVEPTIDGMWLNRTDFASGDAVNESPMLIADVRDDVGINLSSAGVGHQMTITLDGKKTYTDVSLYYTPSADGTPSGSINYPLDNLTDGEHSLRLRIWDTSLNSTESEIRFTVRNGLAPTILETYTDANPASTEANFYIRHDRPDSQITVTVGVYTLMGRLVWQSSVSGRSDMFESSPVTWNLCDMGGRRVPRGIYVYRASITTSDGEIIDSASKKLAVTAH